MTHFGGDSRNPLDWLKRTTVGSTTPSSSETVGETTAPGPVEGVGEVTLPPSRSGTEPPGVGVEPAERTPYLIVIEGTIRGTMLPLAGALVKGGCTLGRAADNALQLSEPTISRCHARIELSSEGRGRVVDLDSSNGTFLNDVRVAPRQPAEFVEGDLLRFGSVTIAKFTRLDPREERFHRVTFERAVRDALTGLHNRAAFLEQVVPLAERQARQGRGLGIILIDVDHFKRINDTRGHDAGDAVLVEVGRLLAASARSGDLVARYGGEEFIAAVPAAHASEASAWAEAIRGRLEAAEILAAGTPIRVTASFGVAFAPPDPPTPPPTLIPQADARLYRAKAEGRNRVVAEG